MEQKNRQARDLRTLSLQQKIVEIRSMIPSLVKRAYSEEVSYDFIKIDDIFQYLTPAMNRFGVNLDIVKENATKKDDLGNPIYVQYLAQNQLWMYEADLTLRWINADQPDDMDERTIHAIGTHEMPEKAKGSAW
ncbi:MAG TPA: single-stranded DNA-binding protein, partial [Candidatus Acetatifactor stercoripullorum]|nr:single-stranded DNA-binding protein [Candidatus Acetatifactor stercoripullorum]